MRIRFGKTALKTVAVLLVLVIVFVVVFWLLSRWETNSYESASYSSIRTLDEGNGSEGSDDSTSDTGSAEDSRLAYDGDREIIYYNGETYAYRDDLELLLLLGVDKFEDQLENADNTDLSINRQQSDFIFLIIFNKTDKTYSAIHINRDTMTDFYLYDKQGNTTGLYNAQIALAHAYGPGGKVSSKNTVFAVSNLLYGIDLEHYVLVTMDAVPIINDSVGGVTVTIEDDFTGVEDDFVMGETITLMGQQALTFIRSRKSMSVESEATNIARMKRQKTYLEGLLDAYKHKNSSDSSFFDSTMLKVNDYMESDCTITQLSHFNDLLSEYEFTTYYTPEGTAKLGEKYVEFYVDEDALKDLMVSLFYEKYDINAQ